MTVAATTVALSVYAHGLTAVVGANSYADWVESHPDSDDLAATEPLHQHPGRRRLHHQPSTSPSVAPTADREG